MRAPDFWWSAQPGPFQRLVRALLAPIAALYGRFAVRAMNRGGARVNAPVVCVGNFVAGGAGKTPTALAMAKWLKRAGETPAFLTRGYGGALSADGGAHLVDRRRHGAAETGDEPLLLARVASTVVARDRPSGALLALAGGASLIVMDDGLQNPSLTRDFTLAVIDGAVGFGNGRLIPAGPLRAPLALQLERTDAGLVIGEGKAGDAAARILRDAGKPVFHGRLAPDANAALRMLGAKVVAFAGIGRPGKFFDSLEACGARIVSRQAFPDHHLYRPAEIAALQRRAAAQDALLVTTEKDMVKIAPFMQGLWQDLPQPEALPVTLVVEEAEALRALVLDAVSRARRGQLGDRSACA
ncbi:tetraacyldisaccharide 4'-kinase [Rhodoblastus acidophilus]|uniref:tetraacyldisaccharide 4'-kinase n=1 Tax=Rhodoblastus acidophilus TaxID=1074 RepID=UPI0022256298|nr:tetraacyldisaccharide 4'-kinase [Rhodoblastus acidophilus]MCW2317760.1 tetraacyldisaccharide 4'-kinase [Rhodoblastus acidophilus]